MSTFFLAVLILTTPLICAGIGLAGIRWWIRRRDAHLARTFRPDRPAH